MIVQIVLDSAEPLEVGSTTRSTAQLRRPPACVRVYVPDAAKRGLKLDGGCIYRVCQARFLRHVA